MSKPKTRPACPLIAPSLLKCDFGNLESEIARLEDANARTLHWDVMDGHFVPNLSYGAMVIERLRERTELLFDAHLMITDPARWVDDYLRAGCDWVTIHIEACPDPLPVFRKIRDAGKMAGIALNPETPVKSLQACVGECDLVLVMSVHPGFGGQKFIASSTDKIKEVRELFGSDTLISVDGGIGPKTISQVSAAGAEVFVAGSSIFDQPCYESAIREMEELAAGARI
ncbi:ribulose-phosphate 3-epimerase [Planctomicrobium piriforme]|uniref:Ribulose-phosphate 3-epimerase n=1 Tax=Planctomicrobium piriforme TaxID=1576369 RepID=A0A1I3MST1_9PLAN|nr:ribulose-phosphate 3-epimerase [Planctomicrobium piriforme]SFJ00154.1 ribulose-phosphate 3-epimerase [Planctomicrobium piriforme]